MRKSILFFTLMLVFLVGLFPIYGQKPMALVISAQGKAELLRAGKQSKIKAKTLLMAGDTIKTGAKSKVAVQFSGGVISQIGSNTVIRIDVLKKSGGNLQTALKMEKGSFAMIANKQGAGGSIQVATPTSVAGVRGTEFIVESNGNSTEVSVNDGSVSVSNSDGDEQIAQPGHKVVADAKGLRDSILNAFEKQKFQIMEHLRKSRKTNLEMVIEQIRKNQALMEQMKSKL